MQLDRVCVWCVTALNGLCVWCVQHSMVCVCGVYSTLWSVCVVCTALYGLCVWCVTALYGLCVWCVQHSMVYFFHHYELPAVEQQAHVHNLISLAQRQQTPQHLLTVMTRTATGDLARTTADISELGPAVMDRGQPQSAGVRHVDSHSVLTLQGSVSDQAGHDVDDWPESVDNAPVSVAQVQCDKASSPPSVSDKAEGPPSCVNDQAAHDVDDLTESEPQIVDSAPVSVAQMQCDKARPPTGVSGEAEGPPSCVSDMHKAEGPPSCISNPPTSVSDKAEGPPSCVSNPPSCLSDVAECPPLYCSGHQNHRSVTGLKTDPAEHVDNELTRLMPHCENDGSSLMQSSCETASGEAEQSTVNGESFTDVDSLRDIMSCDKPSVFS